MKYRFLISLFVFSVFILAQSCDKIEAPYIIKTATVDPGVEVTKTLLLEDFTGHQCPNCPEGAAKVQQILDTYGASVVVISIHAGFFARTNSTGYFTTDYKTPTGTELDNFFTISASGLPAGMVNRMGYSTTSQRLHPDNFAGAVALALESEPELGLRITRSYNANSRVASLQIDANTIETLNRKLMLSVMIIEDSIVSPQKNGVPAYGPDPIENFVHRHVLRASVNGTWGDMLADGTTEIPSGTTYNKSYNFTVSTAWDADHVGIVAFIYDGDTYEVIQAAEKHLK